MFFELAETDIKTKLATDLGAGVEVEVLPETLADFKRPFLKSRVEVCYKKSTYQNPRLPHNIVQDEIMQFEIVLTTKLRRGTNGIYTLFQNVCNSIIGFKPTHCRQIYAKSFEIERFDDNLWYWTFTIECESTLVENFTEEAGANLNNLSFIET